MTAEEAQGDEPAAGPAGAEAVRLRGIGASYSRILDLIGPGQRRRFGLLVGLMLLAGLLEFAGVAMILPFLAVVASPDVIASGGTLATLRETLGFETRLGFLQFLGLGVFAVLMLGIAARALTAYMLTLFWRQTAMNLGLGLLRRYLAQPYEWYLGQHSADLGKTVLEEVHDVVVGSVKPGMQVIANGIIVLFLVGLLLVVEPVGALLMSVFLLGCFGLIHWSMRSRLARIGHDRRIAKRQKHQITREAINGIKEVKVLGLEADYLERFLDPSARVVRHQATVTLVGEMPRFALEALAFGGMLLLTLFLMWSRGGAIDEALPVLGAFAFAGLRLMPTVQQLFRDLAEMRFSQPALEGLHADLTAPDPSEPADTGPALPFARSLTLSGVRYRYPGAERDALRGLDIEIAAGTSVGLVGPTGAGKTTVLDILLGLIQPHEGTMSVDGVSVTAANAARWRRNVGYVPQSIFLVDDTIAANIAFGVPPGAIDREAVEAAGRLARLDEVVAGLPDGYDTMIGEAGVRLSGGQRQRIGIARALYRDPDMVIFDEATSALDTVTERAVIDAIRALKGRKTILMVTHRLGTVAGCDRIFVLRGGQLEAEGDYGALSGSSSAFRAMLEAAG